MSKRSRNSSTPHRFSRSSNVLPSPGVHYPIEVDKTPLDEALLPSITELNDSLVDLDSNLQNLQKVHESLISFNESFASFLYGLQINAYTVEFNEIPGSNDIASIKNEEIREKIHKLEEYFDDKRQQDSNDEAYESYLTNDEDGSFLVEPSNKRRATESGNPKSKIPVGRRMTTGQGVGGVLKPTAASERKQRVPVQKSTRPAFR